MKYATIQTKYLILLLYTLLTYIPVFGQSNKSDSLLRQDTIQLKEVVIDEKKQLKLTGAFSGKMIMYADEVKRLPSLMGNSDLLKAMELTPSLATSGDANSNIYVRGGETGQNQIMYNDNRIYSPGHMLNLFPQFNADHISRAELLLGNVGGEYGNYLSAVVAVEGKTEVPELFSLRGGVGLLSSQVTLAMPVNKKIGVYASGRKSYMGLIILPAVKALTKTDSRKSSFDMEDMEYDLYDTNLTVVGEINDRNKLIVDFFHSGDKLNLKDQETGVDGHLKWTNTSFSAKLQSRLSQQTTLYQSLYYTGFDNDLTATQVAIENTLSSYIKDLGYKSKIEYLLSNIKMESGIQYTLHKLQSQKMDVKNSDINLNTEYLGDNIAHNLSFFTSAHYNPHPRLQLSPTIRYTYYHSIIDKQNSSKGFHGVDFRFSGRYQLADEVFLRGSYSYNNQYLNKLTPSSLGLPTDFWVSASSLVKPQKGHNVSFGAYMPLQQGEYEVVADAYYRTMDNITEYNQNMIESDKSIFTKHILYGNGRAYGLETMLKKNAGKLTGWIGYTIGRAERKVDGVNNNKYYSARHDRTHDLNVVAVYKFSDRWDASLSYVYATGNTYTQPSSWYFINNTPVKEYDKYNGARMPAYSRTDLSINYWYKQDNGFNFSIYNMFAVKNPVYIFMVVGTNPKTGLLDARIKKKKMLTIIPSLSWKFKF